MCNQSMDVSWRRCLRLMRPDHAAESELLYVEPARRVDFSPLQYLFYPGDGVPVQMEVQVQVPY